MSLSEYRGPLRAYSESVRASVLNLEHFFRLSALVGISRPVHRYTGSEKPPYFFPPKRYSENPKHGQLRVDGTALAITSLGGVYLLWRLPGVSRLSLCGPLLVVHRERNQTYCGVDPVACSRQR